MSLFVKVGRYSLNGPDFHRLDRISLAPASVLSGGSDALDTPICSGILRRLFRHDGSHLRRQRDLCRLSPGGSGPMALIAAQAGHAARRRQNGAGRFLRCELRSSAFADGDNRGPDQFSLSVRPTRPWAHCSPSASHDEDNAPGSRHGRLDEGHARLGRRSTGPPSR